MKSNRPKFIHYTLNVQLFTDYILKFTSIFIRFVTKNRDVVTYSNFRIIKN